MTAGAFGYWHSVVGLGVNVGEVSIEAAKATIRVLAGVQSSTKVRVTPCGHSLSSEPQEANSIWQNAAGAGIGLSCPSGIGHETDSVLREVRWAADRTLKDILPEQERDYERVNKMESL